MGTPDFHVKIRDFQVGIQSLQVGMPDIRLDIQDFQVDIWVGMQIASGGGYPLAETVDRYMPVRVGRRVEVPGSHPA
jgi:hypothetical protein